MILLTILVVFSGCAIGPAPKMDTCIVYMKPVRHFDCKNHKGTRFKIKFNTTNEDNIKYLDRHISAPGNQVIDFITWVKKAMTHLSNTYYNKR